MTHSAAHDPTVRIDVETAADAAAVEAVVLAAFGPGRFAKTAERLREQMVSLAGFVAREDHRVIGSVRLWPIRVGDTDALFLGPIAVEAVSRRAGLGADLVAACVDHARAEGVSGVLLVGDMPYFSRFGFAPSPDVDLPGPVDRRRLLWLPLTVPSVSGPVRPIG
ncbi:N-acetyltransferase [uncultured Brevundimonas sp.]|uniref:GNAT family N-acetyltransferase n=1 Tax=uncultured Brevundimonas sp. TaxID=213418 RepID=UPI0030EF7F14|tara:strand:+ start:20971 stop:21465 length:495 start_codon:yes stop_codon:yes gene_type:complete